MWREFVQASGFRLTASGLKRKPGARNWEPTVIRRRTGTLPFGPAAAFGSASRTGAAAFHGFEVATESPPRSPRWSRQRPLGGAEQGQADPQAGPRHADTGA